MINNRLIQSNLINIKLIPQLYIQKIFKSIQHMSFPILEEYQKSFPASAELIATFSNLYTKKLWNELTIAVLEFIFDHKVKGKITFTFYTQFVKRFQKNIDQINLLKIIRQSFASLSNQDILIFLQQFENKEASTDEIKIIVNIFKGYYSIPHDLESASKQIAKAKAYIESHKDIDTYIYSSYYKLSFTFYAAKKKYKLFYNSTLQYLAYTQSQEIEENQKLNLLFEMAIAVLVSDQIYNFSQLLEQPLLVELKKSSYAWMYELIQIFNRGDINKFYQKTLQNDELNSNKDKLDAKIRIMGFLQLAFNLPKSNRVVTFVDLGQACKIPVQQVQFMIMKTMALGLVKGSINQVKGHVTISWVAPKVLQIQRISTMLLKFQEWESGVKGVESLIKTIKI